jgi:GT2 family glycosyltransferase
VDGTGAIFETVIAAPFDLAATLGGRNSVNQPGTFWRREAGERVGPFDESLHFSMDLEYWVRAALKGETIRYVPGIRSAFRFHGESKTVSRAREWLAEWDAIYGRLMREYADDPATLRFLRECYARYSLNYAMHFYVHGVVDEVRPLMNHALRHHPSLIQRAVALLLVADARLGTSFARRLRVIVRRARGQKI